MATCLQLIGFIVLALTGIRAAGAEPRDEAAEKQQSARAQAEEVATFTAGTNQFAFDLYRRLRNTDGNFALAPCSIAPALAMTLAGASGRTEVEIAHALGAVRPNDALHEAMKRLLRAWNRVDDAQGQRLTIANRIWVREGLELLPRFVETTRQQYDAECEHLPFDMPEQARQTINTWMADATDGHIPQLLTPGALTRDTRLALTCAMYFRAHWARPFDRQRTQPLPFRVAPDKEVNVPLMHQQGPYRYAAIDDAQLLEIPYRDETLSMIIILPELRTSIQDFETRLTAESLQQWTKALEPRPAVDLYLPRFQCRSRSNLAPPLGELGVRSAFEPARADFTRMTPDGDLWISAVIHETWVDVNEEGTQAAAATAVIAEPTGAAPQPSEEVLVFRADRPFLYLIYDHQHQAVLLLGRVMDPRAEQ